MNLQPHCEAFLGTCYACAHPGASIEFSKFQMVYCEDTCKPDGHNGFEQITKISDPLVPHLHVTCPRCGYTWLMAPYSPDRCIEIRRWSDQSSTGRAIS